MKALYGSYKYPIENLLKRYNNFNSAAYIDLINQIVDTVNSEILTYFISEDAYTYDNIRNIPLLKFKSDFYKELLEYKERGKH